MTQNPLKDNNIIGYGKSDLYVHKIHPMGIEANESLRRLNTLGDDEMVEWSRALNILGSVGRIYKMSIIPSIDRLKLLNDFERPRSCKVKLGD